MEFVKVNLNPKDRKASDCVIRAIMQATGKDWHEVYDGLVEIGRNEFCIPNERRSYEKYLEDNGFAKCAMPRFPNKKRYTVNKFAEINPKGTFVISIARHLTCVINGTLYDTWDCSRKSVGNYWQKEE